ncbi:arylamine N-acetyltransferase [Crocinitomicaceae bacterium]|nr:arylamine N-acetyltransferase [Crocinitomicaceae bacterium]
MRLSETNIKLRDIDSVKKFGLAIMPHTVKLFLEKVDVTHVSNSIEFVNLLITSVIAQVPFQNQTMLSRGFGVIPKAEDIIEDMVTLRGGTCGTMNIFFGALLYSLDYDTCLIQGTMQKKDDHIGILLSLNSEKYIVDIGDGQPFFEAFSCQTDIEVFNPFKTYRSIALNSELTIQFLIENEWVTDSTFNLIPKTFKEVERTLICHYKDSEFGPFWKGIRFAMYPNKKIIAIRDQIFYRELPDNSIKRTKIQNMNELDVILTEHLPSYKESIIESFHKFHLL